MNTFTLPYPPTTNNLFFNAGKRRVRTKGYDAWLEEAAAMIAQQKPAKVAGPYVLMIRANRPDRRARDLGNIEKPVSDLLVKCGVVRDDSDAQAILLTWTDAAPARPTTVAVTVKEV